MLLSILDERNKLLSWLLRRFAPHGKQMLDQYEDSLPGTLGTVMLLAYAAVPTFVGNVLLPGHLISMGLRPQPIVESIHFAKGLSYPKPIWTVFHGSSPASKVGQRLGKRIAGKAGVKLGARIGGRLIPGVGWALLAYDVYDIAYNRSLWGFDF